MTLGRHHKPFGSARTARGLRALDLAGALHALWRTERRGAREKGVDQDRRTIRDWPHQRVLRRQRGLECIWVLRNVSRTARGGTCPAGIESSSRRFGGGPQNAILAVQAPWYKFEARCPLMCQSPLFTLPCELSCWTKFASGHPASERTGYEANQPRGSSDSSRWRAPLSTLVTVAPVAHACTLYPNPNPNPNPKRRPCHARPGQQRAALLRTGRSREYTASSSTRCRCRTRISTSS